MKPGMGDAQPRGRRMMAIEICRRCKPNPTRGGDDGETLHRLAKRPVGLQTPTKSG